MNLRTLWMVLGALLLLGSAFGCGKAPQRPDEQSSEVMNAGTPKRAEEVPKEVMQKKEEAVQGVKLATEKPRPITEKQAIAEIKRVGGEVVFGPGHQVTTVDLTGAMFTTEGMQKLDLKYVGALSTLKYLTLRNTPIDSVELEQLSGLTSLEALRLCGTSVGDAGLEHLKGLNSLKNLDLSATLITNAGLAYLEGMPSLTALTLSQTAVTDDGLEYLTSLSNLTYLDLSQTRTSNVGLRHLKGMASLTTLNLSATQITDVGLAQMSGLTNLDTLLVTHTRITSRGLEHIKALPAIKILYLNGTHVTDLDQLDGMTSLKHLYLKETNVPPTAVRRLKQALPNLQTVVWEATPEGLAAEHRAVEEAARMAEEEAERKKEKEEQARKDEAKAARTRTWTSDMHKLNAEFVKLVGNIVYLRRIDDGREIKIPIDALSDDDQEFIRKRKWID